MVLGGRPHRGRRLFIQGRRLAPYREAIPQGAVGNPRRHDGRIAGQAPLDALPRFCAPRGGDHAPDASRTHRGGAPRGPGPDARGPRALAGAVPAGLTDRSGPRSTPRRGSSGPALGSVEALQRLMGTEDEARHIPLNMRKALGTAAHITRGGPPLGDGGRHPDERQPSLAPLWGSPLLDSLLRLCTVRLVEGNNLPSGGSTRYRRPARDDRLSGR
jgi:hypothetical protein